MSRKTALSMIFKPLDALCVTDDTYKYKVALYNAKDKCFHMGEVECDGLKIMVSYRTAEYYGIDVEIINNFDNWYYMIVDDADIDVSWMGECE